MSTVPTPRMRVSTAQIDHFIAFITSPHIIQKFAYWRKNNHVIDEGDYQGSKRHTDDYP